MYLNGLLYVGKDMGSDINTHFALLEKISINTYGCSKDILKDSYSVVFGHIFESEVYIDDHEYTPILIEILKKHFGAIYARDNDNKYCLVWEKSGD